MKKRTITKITVAVVVAVFAIALLSPLSLQSQKPPTAVDASVYLLSILAVHHAWITPPNSIRIHGTSIRKDVKLPITITATAKEETLTEYGTSKRVATPSLQFQDDGEKTTFGDSLSSFGQLDITNVFLMSQLTQRKEQAGAVEVTASNGVRVMKIHISNSRTQIQYRQIKVTDELDVFVDASGMLAGVERTFYPQDSRLRYTLGYRFSDYRYTGGVLLPYRIETVFKGYTEETIVVNDYQVDVVAASSLFQPRVQTRSAQ